MRKKLEIGFRILMFFALGLWVLNGNVYRDFAKAGSVANPLTGEIYPVNFSYTIRFVDRGTLDLYNWTLYGSYAVAGLTIMVYLLARFHS